MLAGPTSSIRRMSRAIACTYNMLTVASKVDIDRSAEDRAFCAAEAAKHATLQGGLPSKQREIEDVEFGPGNQNQSAVVLGCAK